MNVLVVDFGSQWTHRIWRRLRYLECETKIIPVTTPVEEIDADGLILSGGAVRIGSGGEEEVGYAHEYLDELHIPILGICAGQQFIALHFGGDVQPARHTEYGRVEIIIKETDDLFVGVPERFVAWASHNDEIINCPGFDILAVSKDDVNHAIKHRKKPIYGTLFHPEVEHTEYGETIMKNFLEVCKQ
ncbi:MAG: GMP synthase subunit A [Candidatus Diapherotrites archaeon]|nr:GMP synthase subunit A [Candidatus Diapherotrites archaeon]